LSEDVDGDLLRFLRSHLGEATLGYLVPPRRFAQGMFSDVRGFTLNAGPKEWMGPLVLRVLPYDADPQQPVLEAAVQNGIARAGMPTPFVLLVHDQVDVLGRMFMVMEQRPGKPSLGGVRWDLFARDLPHLLVSWPAALARIAIDLHACETDSVFEEAEARGIEPQHLAPERHLLFVEDHLSRFGGPGVTHGLEWLRSHIPATSGRTSVLHGDLWPANVLRHRGKLTGLVDWERAAIGDPEFDIGFAKVGLELLPAPAIVPPPIRQAINAAGRSMAERLEVHYSTHNPLSPERVKYYEALRCALELAVVAGRRTSTQPDIARSGWCDGVDALSRHFGRITGTQITLPDPST
jgi:aminoglycoside phosphotransferase (APT) family kinase protein